MKTKHIVPLSLSLSTVFLIIIFRKNPQITERVYSNSFYPVVANILSHISSIVPFSLSDIFYLLLIIWFLTALTLVIIKKRKFNWFFKNLLIGIAYIFSFFYLFWGFNYHRLNIFNRIQLTKIETNSLEMYEQTFKQIINDANTNYLSAKFIPDVGYIDKSIEESFEENADFLHINYPCGKRNVKPISLSMLFAKSGILGYFGPFFNEVHTCSKLTKWDIPMVTAHEKAHQFGITGEGEANFYAWLVCSKSKCQWNRYSAAIYSLSMFLSNHKDLKIFTDNLLPEVKNDIIMRNNYWKSIQNENLGDISSFINDTYLKGNSVEKGINDYDTMVELIVAYKNKFSLTL